MTAADFAMHSRSECALHRWDLVGRDDVGWAMLGTPALTRARAHGPHVDVDVARSSRQPARHAFDARAMHVSSFAARLTTMLSSP